MKTYTFEKLPNEPIVISTPTSAWRAATELAPFLEEFVALMDTLDEPVFYIADQTQWQPDLMDLILAANSASRAGQTFLQHPKVREFVMVSHLPAVELAAKGMNSAAFGHILITVFHTLDEALSYTRGKIREHAL